MLLAALPATPVQLAHACYQLGFEIVVPASWGDELVAHAVLEDLRHRDREPVIQCTCPLVFERLLANGQHLLPSMVQTASPAVAAARYARQAFAPRHLNITYVGACPGARHTSIDERCVPDELLRALAEHDISIADMPTVFDSVLPPDRRRFVSLPGGCPSQEALWQASDGRMLREVTQPTFSTDLAQTLVWREHVMVDVAPSLGCACAGSCSRLGARSGRVAVMAVEPPRATQPVLHWRPEYTATPLQAPVAPELGNGDTPRSPSARPHDAAEPVDPAPVSEREPEQTVAAVSRSRARVRTPTPLPRAYLAKRRHIATAAAAETTPPDEPLPVEAHAPPQESLAVEPTVAPNEPSPVTYEAPPPLYVPEPEPAVVPNEPSPVAFEAPFSPYVPEPEPAVISHEVSPEPAEVSRPIAVHVEPEPHTSEDASPQQVQVAEVDVRVEVPQDVQGHLLLEESLSHESVATATLDAADDWFPPTEPGVSIDEPVEGPTEIPLSIDEPIAQPTEFPITVDEPAQPRSPERSGPLRVEVEIFEEAEPLPSGDAIVADPVTSDPSPQVALPEPAEPQALEIAVKPRSAWADFLIALWLVLVASAVIAALLWRR